MLWEADDRSPMWLGVAPALGRWEVSAVAREKLEASSNGEFWTHVTGTPQYEMDFANIDRAVLGLVPVNVDEMLSTAIPVEQVPAEDREVFVSMAVAAYVITRIALGSADQPLHYSASEGFLAVASHLKAMVQSLTIESYLEVAPQALVEETWAIAAGVAARMGVQPLVANDLLESLVAGGLMATSALAIAEHDFVLSNLDQSAAVAADSVETGLTPDQRDLLLEAPPALRTLIGDLTVPWILRAMPEAKGFSISSYFDGFIRNTRVFSVPQISRTTGDPIPAEGLAALAVISLGFGLPLVLETSEGKPPEGFIEAVTRQSILFEWPALSADYVDRLMAWVYEYSPTPFDFRAPSNGESRGYEIFQMVFPNLPRLEGMRAKKVPWYRGLADLALGEFAVQRCQEAFETYVGQS